MENVGITRLSAAAGTGELLVVIYAGGKAPGHKRRVVIRSVNEEADEINVLENGQIRTYRISKTTVVDENDPAPWMPSDNEKVAVVDPDEYFADWAYTIRSELRLALGVFPRYVIDKEKTALARNAAIERGVSKTEATKRFRIMKREVVINVPPVYGFEEGDIFYRGIHGGADWAQVRSVKGEQIEVHLPSGGDCLLSAEKFAALLQSGRRLGGK